MAQDCAWSDEINTPFSALSCSRKSGPASAASGVQVDASDTSLLIGAAIDTKTHETFFNLEAERRFGDNITVDFRVRAFSSAEPGETLYSFEQDDYLQLRLNWYY